MSDGFTLTTCPYCGCGCMFYLVTVDGRAVDVAPCFTDRISEGKLCVKGRRAHEFIHHADRLTKPLVRRDGRLVEASWDEALDTVAAGLRRIRDVHGPDALGVLASAKCTNEENYLIQKLARAVIGTNNVDHCARLCHASTVAGLAASFGSGAMTNSIPDLLEADCLLVTGSNTVETHPLIGARVLRAREAGATLIVVDPRETPLSARADFHLRQRPGTDVAWANGFVNVILAEGLEDKEFIRERTEGFAELVEVVREYTPERVEEIAGIPAALLREAARAYARAGAAAILYAMGVTQHSTGTNGVRAIANLAMVTGNIGKPGSGVNPLRGQNNVQGACDMGCLPPVLPGYQRVDDAALRAKFEAAWGVKLPAAPGLTVVEMTAAAEQGRIRGFYVIGENPLLSDPDIGHVREALGRLELLVVQDIFLSETARLAHVVLPAACFAEKEGTFTNTDRTVLRVRKAVEPPGEARTDAAIVQDLARRLGATGFDQPDTAAVFAEMASLTPAYAGISHERLDRGEVLAWPCPAPDHPGTPILHCGKFTRGKGRFAAVAWQPPQEAPDAEYPLVLTTGRTLFHYHTGTMTRRVPLLEREVPTGYVEINPRDAERLGVSDGERVEVRSRRGAIDIAAAVTERVPPGTVFVPFHFAECAANALTHAALDPEAKIPELKVCAVRVTKRDSA